MTRVPSRFPRNDIISLTSESVRYDLAESVGPDLRLGALLSSGIVATLMDLDLAYGTAAGSPSLRQLIASRHGVDGDDVVVTAGGMQALFLLAFIVCGAGDDAVIGSPVFPNSRTVLQAVGANVLELPIMFDEGYRLNIERLESALTPRTRLVSLASPQNPSGVALEEAEVRSALACIERICPQAFLLVDETYREAVYGGNALRDSVAGLDERIVSCASLSKCHGAPGLRTGWVITRSKALREQLTLGKFNTTISTSLVDEALAAQVLRDQDRIVGERRVHLQLTLERTAEFVRGHEELVDWVRPDAGALCCMRLKPAAFDDAAVARFYAGLKARDVRVGNGSWFGEPARVFRVGFGLLGVADFNEALARLSAALAAASRVAAQVGSSEPPLDPAHASHP
jgi:aspartate/methionine/tyrosine aminotransferase